MRITQEIAVYNTDAIAKKFSKVDQRADSISVTVGQKVGYNEIISSINQSAEQITISASRVKFEGLVTANGYFKILSDGSIEARNATLYGTVSSVGKDNNNNDIVTRIGDGKIQFRNGSSLAGTFSAYSWGDDTLSGNGMEVTTAKEYMAIGWYTASSNKYNTAILINNGLNPRNSYYHNVTMSDAVLIWRSMTCCDPVTHHNRLIIAKEYGFGIVNESGTVDYGSTGTASSPTGTWKWATITDSNGNTCHIPAHYS